MPILSVQCPGKICGKYSKLAEGRTFLRLLCKFHTNSSPDNFHRERLALVRMGELERVETPWAPLLPIAVPYYIDRV